MCKPENHERHPNQNLQPLPSNGLPFHVVCWPGPHAVAYDSEKCGNTCRNALDILPWVALVWRKRIPVASIVCHLHRYPNIAMTCNFQQMSRALFDCLKSVGLKHCR